MKKISIMLLVLLSIVISGCGSKVLGEPKSAYKPVYIDKVHESELAFVKASSKLGFWSVDGKRIVNATRLLFGNGADSVKVKEGKHSFRLQYKKTTISLGSAYYKKGHEYLVDYVEYDKKIHYWVKDLNTNEIIVGKEIKDNEEM